MFSFFKDIVESVNENGKYICPSCHQKFSYVFALKNHFMNSHVDVTNAKPSKPKQRRKKVKKEESETKNGLFDSIVEAGDGSFLCDQCPFIGSKEDLTWHVKQIHRDR